MADIETPEADALEQHEPPVVEDLQPTLGIETPEADALEQAQLAAPTEHRLIRPVRDDVPEADAWEQSAGLGTEDDYEH